MKRIIDKISIIVICLIVILNLGTVYSANNYNLISIVSLIAVGIVAFWTIVNNVQINKNAIFFLLIYLMLMVPFAIISKSGSGILMFIGFIPLFWLISFYYQVDERYKTLLRYFVNLVIFIGAISLAIWILLSCLHILKPTGMATIAWGGQKRLVPTYHNIYFECQHNTLILFNVNIKIRNCGIFSEAPMASFVYSSALLANCYLTDNKRGIKELLLLTMIISTFSTTGVIVVIGYCVAAFFCKTHQNQLVTITKYIITFVLGIFALIGIKYLLLDKLSTGSGLIRMNKLASEFNAFLESPIWGNGFNKYTNGSSNSLTSILADGGILLFSFYYFPIIVVMVKYRKDKIKFTLSLLYCGMLLITSVAYSYLNTIVIIALWKDVLYLKKKVYSRILIFYTSY